MEPLEYDYSWQDLSEEDGIVIQKCTVFGADLAYRSPQFPDWIHIETDNGTVTVLNGYDPKWKHDCSLLDWEFDGMGGLIDSVIGYGFQEMLKEYDGVFVDMATLYERYKEWDGEGNLDTTDIVKPYNY